MWVEQRAHAGFHAEIVVKPLFGIGYDRKRQTISVRKEFLHGRVENDDLPNRRGENLMMALHNRMQVQVAYRAAGEAPELQMYDPFAIRDLYSRGTYSNKLMRLDFGPWLNSRSL